MFRSISLLLIASLLSPAVAAQWPSLADPTKLPDRPGLKDGALIIAIEDYMVVEDVQGAGTNAADWDQWFDARGVPLARIMMLRDSEAVRETILRQAEDLAKEMPEGGTLWVVYIGHGAPSADGKDGVLVGADAQQKAEILYARSVTRSELLARLSMGKQAETVLVLDACFSGKSASGGALVPGLQPLVPVDIPRVARVTVLSAGAGNEFAGSLPGVRRPAFSYLTLGALHGWREADSNGDGGVTLGEAVAYSRAALRRLVKDRRQTPEIAGPLVDLKVAQTNTEGPDLRTVASDEAQLQIPEAPLPKTKVPEAQLTQAKDPDTQLAEAPVPQVLEAQVEAVPARAVALKRWATQPCGAIIDQETRLEWLIGPDKNMSWYSAVQWVQEASACGGGWRMPTTSELAGLFEQASTAGTGFRLQGKRYPAHLDPAFSAIGGGSWVWSAQTEEGADAWSFNFNRGKPVRYPRRNTEYSTRAFGVRQVR